MDMKLLLCTALVFGLLSWGAAPTFAQNCTTEDFQTTLITFPWVGGFVGLGVTSLDSSTAIAAGGPGLVQAGCSYTTTGLDLVWWEANNNLPTNCLSSTWSGQIAIEYDAEVDQVDVVLHAYFADVVDAYAYDAAGNILQTHSAVAVPSATSVPVSFTHAGIRKVEFVGQQAGDSPFIGEHTYCTAGPTLSLTAACPGVGNLNGSGMSAGGMALVGWSFVQGSWVLPAGIACAGTTLGLVTPNLLMVAQADANGDFSIPVNVPGGACGNVALQAVDRLSCVASNLIAL